MANENFGNSRTSVTGSMLQTQRFLDKNVRLIGNVVKNSSDAIEVNTGDNFNVKVKFRNPLDGPLEGLIDVHGKLVGKNNIEADSFIMVPEQLAENFDLAMYNEAITYIASSENPWSPVES